LSDGAQLKKIEVTMPFQAKHRFARISPRKARLLMDLVRGRDVE
jgi:ribosomal protein L22